MFDKKRRNRNFYLEKVFVFRFIAKYNVISIINELKLFIVNVIDSVSLRSSPVSATEECSTQGKKFGGV